MNKYKLKIVQEDGMYVGYALENDEVKAKTAPCKDSVTASRNLSILIGRVQSPSLPIVHHMNRPTSVFKASTPSAGPISNTAATAPQSQAPRRCCGRS